MRRSLVPISVLVALVGLVAGSARPAVAQDATPVASPGAAVCTVEPRTADELIALWFEDVAGTPTLRATPTPQAVAAEAELPAGEPADAATLAAIVATVREVEACFNAGEFARGLALFTDDLVRQFGPGEGTAAEVRAFLEAPPLAAPAEGRPEPATVREARVLPDGRVGAVLVELTAEGPEDAFFVVFERVGERWLADDFVEIEEAGTPAAGTPEP